MPVIIAAGNHGADLDDVARCRVDKPIGAHGLAIDGGRQECEGHLALGDPARERDVDLRAVIEGAQRPPGRIVAVEENGSRRTVFRDYSLRLGGIKFEMHHH